MDRLGRTAKGLLTLLDELQPLNVGFVSLREGFDLSTPAGRLMAGVLASVAAYEIEVRKERQLAGIEKAQADPRRILRGTLAKMRTGLASVDVHDATGAVRRLDRKHHTSVEMFVSTLPKLVPFRPRDESPTITTNKLG